MKLILTNSSGRDIWATASGISIGGNHSILIEFFLTDDPIENELPDKVPDVPGCIEIDLPNEPIEYLAPAGFYLNVAHSSAVSPSGDPITLINITNVIPNTPAPNKPMN